MSTPSRLRPSRLGLSPGMVLEGRFRLDALLGAGGGGEVWKAVEAVADRAWASIALKLLRTPGDDPISSAPPDHDWLQEARAVRQVRCEALPQIHGVGTVRLPGGAQVPFLAMELLSGQTLEDRLAQGPLRWRKALAVARHIAAALDACHAAGVVHCDLKPRNVFLEEGPRRRVLVLDFGVASLGGARPTMASAAGPASRSFDETDVQPSAEPEAAGAPAAPPIVGTPGYISPERLSGLLPDHRDDAFALGVVLHRMIAGHLPQRLPAGIDSASSSDAAGPGPVALSLHRATIERMFTPLDVAAPGAPRALVDLVATLLGPREERPPRGGLKRCLDEVYHRPHGRPDVPYTGLEAFGERRMGHLPGRAGDVETIARRLRDQVLLVLAGPSGTGKSSLAMAGVAARLDEEMLLDTEGWEPLVVRPSHGRAGLRHAGGDDAAAIETTPPIGTAATVGTLVVVDQLEEVLSLGEEARGAFCRAFLALAARSAAVEVGARRIGHEDLVRVVATVRDDLFGRVALLPELDRLLEGNLYMVRGVDPNAARDIVEGPLAGTGFTLERAEGVDVVGDVAQALREDASALPLVQFALARLWALRDEDAKVLRAQSWKALGGITGALGEAAQGVLDEMGEPEEDATKRLFLSLFDVDGTRRVIDEAALDTEARAVVVRWTEAGLVRRRAEEGGRAVIEPLHEALARGWETLRRWLDEVRVERELVRDAQRDAARWYQHGRPADMLWGETLLARSAVLDGIESEPGRSFVRASGAAVEEARAVAERARVAAERARRSRLGLGAGVSVVVAAVALAGWWTTNEAKKRADQAAAEAKRSEQRASDSEKEALRQKGEAEAAKQVAERREGEAEEAKRALATQKEVYRQGLKELKAELRAAKTIKELDDLKRRIDDKGKLEPAATVRPEPAVLPPREDPFKPE